MSDKSQSQTKKSNKKDAGYSVDHQKLHAIQDELSQSYEELTSPKLRLNQYLIEKLVRNMHKPQWMLQTHNSIRGSFEETMIDLKVNYTFHLDTKTLKKKLNKQDRKIWQNLNDEAKKLGGDDLSKLINASISPYAIGTLENRELISLVVTDKNGAEIKATLPEEGYILMYAGPQLIHFNYVDLLTMSATSQNFHFKLDQNNFEQQVFLAVEYLNTKKKVKESYQWNQKNALSDLSILINTTFEPL